LHARRAISANASSASLRVAKHRAALKAKGMRLVQIWVPDPDNPS
jgi:hypothetical protein